MEALIVDFSPVTTMLVQIAAAALLAALTVGSRWIMRLVSVRLGLSIEDAQRAKVQQALENAVTFAQGKVVNYITARDNLQVRSELIQHGADYVLDKLPAALAYLDVDDQPVADMVDSLSRDALRSQVVAG